MILYRTFHIPFRLCWLRRTRVISASACSPWFTFTLSWAAYFFSSEFSRDGILPRTLSSSSKYRGALLRRLNSINTSYAAIPTKFGTDYIAKYQPFLATKWSICTTKNGRKMEFRLILNSPFCYGGLLDKKFAVILLYKRLLDSINWRECCRRQQFLD